MQGIYRSAIQPAVHRQQRGIRVYAGTNRGTARSDYPRMCCTHNILRRDDRKRRERQDITIYCKNEELPSSQIAVMRVITLKESFDTSPYYQILT